MIIKFLLVSVAAAALSACTAAGPSPTHSASAAAAQRAATAAARPEIGTWGVDLAGMDRSVGPGQDWARFVNGTYQAELEIPVDRSNYGMFTKLRDLSQERTRTVIEMAAEHGAATGGVAQKVGDYYATYLDEAAAEMKGLAPLQPVLDRIAAVQTRGDLAKLLGEANRHGVTTPFGIGVVQDLKQNDRYAVYLGQGGIGMPDRDYYLDGNIKFVDARQKYQAHIANMLRLAGVSAPERRAARIYDLERRIAQAHWSQVEQRQVEKLYNPSAPAEFATKYPGVDWPAFFAAAGVAGQNRIIVANPSAIAGAARLVASQPLQAWKDYLSFHNIKTAAPVLNKALVEENFAFDGQVLSGQPEIQPRWKRGVDAVNAALGEAVGELYVARYFPPDAKARADELVRNITRAMDRRLESLAWMDPVTKVKARAKLAAFTPKIGYPDRWRDYSKLEIVRGDAYGNVRRASAFEYQRNLDKLGKAVDRSEWFMTPQTVNAYANPLMNEIVFPAAILQAPFFDPNADPAVNYGGIGMVIGHEISHHFDDQGRKFDPRGNLADWWTPADVERFNALATRVVKQYGAYEPLPGKHVNGELTLGENIADLAGLTVAYDAYRISLGGKEAALIDGLSGDQRFFLGSAQIWRQKYRDAELLKRLTMDPHTPGQFRPYAARNLDAWYAAWNVKPGEPLYLAPDARIRIW